MREIRYTDIELSCPLHNFYQPGRFLSFFLSFSELI